MTSSFHCVCFPVQSLDWLGLSLRVIDSAKGEFLWKWLSFIFAYQFTSLLGNRQLLYLHSVCLNKQPSHAVSVLCWNRPLKNRIHGRERGLSSNKRKSRMGLFWILFI